MALVVAARPRTVALNSRAPNRDDEREQLGERIVEHTERFQRWTWFFLNAALDFRLATNGQAKVLAINRAAVADDDDDDDDELPPPPTKRTRTLPPPPAKRRTFVDELPPAPAKRRVINL